MSACTVLFMPCVKDEVLSSKSEQTQENKQTTCHKDTKSVTTHVFPYNSS